MPGQDWTDLDLERQFANAQSRGWLPLFRASAAKHALPVELLLAIASRESNMENKLGDFVNGSAHGFGLMQIDIGTDLAFCRSWTPDKVAETIEKAAQLLAAKRAWLISRNVPVGLMALTASYNTGESNVKRSIEQGFSPDRTTKYGNYAADVLKRMSVFAELLKKVPVTQTA